MQVGREMERYAFSLIPGSRITTPLSSFHQPACLPVRTTALQVPLFAVSPTRRVSVQRYKTAWPGLGIH